MLMPFMHAHIYHGLMVVLHLGSYCLMHWRAMHHRRRCIVLQRESDQHDPDEEALEHLVSKNLAV